MNSKNEDLWNITEAIPNPIVDPENFEPLRFEAISITRQVERNEVSSIDFETNKGAVLTLHFETTTTYHVDGSAILVAPGVALAAAHVVRPHIKEIAAGRKFATCIGPAPHGMQIWKVLHISILATCDIAILGLEYRSPIPPDRTFRQVYLTTRTPKMGERLIIMGFHTPIAFIENKQGVNHYLSEGALLVCSGPVTERYPRGRDRCVLPWPVVEVRCPAWGGMSGGPVFGEDGRLVGVLCSSFEAEDNEGPSYVSLLWPALFAKFKGGWPGSQALRADTLLGIDPRACFIEGRDAIGIGIHPDTGDESYFYTQWE